MSLGTIKKRQETAVRQSPFAKKLGERRSGRHGKNGLKKPIVIPAPFPNPRKHAIVLEELYEAGWHPSQAYKPAQTEEIRQLLLELAAANVKSTRKAMKRWGIK